MMSFSSHLFFTLASLQSDFNRLFRSTQNKNILEYIQFEGKGE